MATYVVKAGDTLYEIAQRYNTTVDRLMELNNLENPNRLYVGQVLTVDGNSPGNQQFTPAPGQPYSTAYFDGLLYIISTDQRVYQRGRDTVKITLVKCNVSSSTITLRYDTGQRVDFVALRGGREVWRWSDDQFFTQATGTVTLRPGECETYTATWNLRNKQGNYVAIDDFQIRGYNVARNLRNRFVSTNIRVQRSGAPAPGDDCPQGNLLQDPSIERWRGPNRPTVWSGENLYRTTISQSGQYAGELGAVHNRSATLSQSVNITANRLYRVTFWARENVQPGGRANYTLEVEIRLYNRQGNFISRIDPVYRPQSIPNNSYQQYSYTTGLIPAGAARGDLRFIFRPGSDNNNTVKIDNVRIECIR